jgi:glucose/arabinose dehydrogenase
VSGLEFPTGIAFDSKGTMYVNERPGRVRVVRDGHLLSGPLATIPTSTAGETGLLGIAVAPGERSVYVFATAPDGAANRVLRVPVEGGEPEVVVEGLPASVYHNGGGIAFDGQGMLLVSNGEQHDQARSQDPGVLGGKVYRFTPEGGIPADNPFGNSPALAIGLRNPFGLAVDPVSGSPFVTENGPDAFDEVDRIVPGGNYGWPVVSGPAGGPVADVPGSYRDPLLSYEQIVVPTGIAFADPATALPAYRGDLFFATYGEGAIHRVQLDEPRREATSDEVFVRAGEPVIALAWGPRGLYFSTPDAVKLVPLVERRADERRDAKGPRRSPDAPASPAGDATPPGAAGEARREEPSALRTALQLVVGAVLVGAIVWSLTRGRRT